MYKKLPKKLVVQKHGKTKHSLKIFGNPGNDD